jgi:hypothetical protein
VDDLVAAPVRWGCMRYLLIGAGVGLAGLVELFGWALPSAVRQVAQDPSIGPGPGVAVGTVLVACVLLAGGGFANWLVLAGARPASR